MGGRVETVTDSSDKATQQPDDTHDSGHGSEEEIDESSDESFPASDPPQWWSGEPDDNDK